MDILGLEPTATEQDNEIISEYNVQMKVYKLMM